MSTDFIAIGERIRGIREACDVTAADMAADLDVDLETYIQWEETGADVRISAIYHMANRFGIEFTEILTGKSGHLDTFHLIKAGEGREVDRLPLSLRGPRLALHPKGFPAPARHARPHDEPAELVDHRGQEFNYILEGSIVFTFDDREIVLDAGTPSSSTRTQARATLQRQRTCQVPHHHFQSNETVASYKLSH